MKIFVVQSLEYCVQPIGVFSDEKYALDCARKLALIEKVNSVTYGVLLDDNSKCALAEDDCKVKIE